MGPNKHPSSRSFALGRGLGIWFWMLTILVFVPLACSPSLRNNAAPIETREGSPGPTVKASTTTTGVRNDRGGEQLYVAMCQTCHGGATSGSMMDIPPPHNANGHTWRHPDCQLVEFVLTGSGSLGGMGEMMRRMMGASEDTPPMPTFKGALTEDDALTILHYMKGWWTEGQRQFQANLTQQTCGR